MNGEKIPVWIADYVLSSYGTGAIMAVPAHDERDYEFAKKFNSSITQVIGGGDISQAAYTETQTGELVNSGDFTGLSVSDAQKAITDQLEKKNIGSRAVRYKLRDWVFSRQRYWGEPIPMIHCEQCEVNGTAKDGWVKVPESELPLVLPSVEKYEPTDDGQSPLSVITDQVKTAVGIVVGRPHAKQTPCQTGLVQIGIFCAISIRTTTKSLPIKRQWNTGCR